MPDFKVDRGRTMTEDKLNQILNGIHSRRVNDSSCLSNDVNNACRGSIQSISNSTLCSGSAFSSPSLPELQLSETLSPKVIPHVKRSRHETGVFPTLDVSDVELLDFQYSSPLVILSANFSMTRTETVVRTISSTVKLSSGEGQYWDSSPVLVSRSGRAPRPTKRFDTQFIHSDRSVFRINEFPI
jgi:hypothetical protein